MRERCTQTNAWVSVVFCPVPTKSGIDIVEWLALNANVLDFRFIFALLNYSANFLRLGTKNGANFGFFDPRLFQGHFKEIDIIYVRLYHVM